LAGEEEKQNCTDLNDVGHMSVFNK